MLIILRQILATSLDLRLSKEVASVIILFLCDSGQEPHCFVVTGSRDLLGHEYAILHGLQQTTALTSEGRSETLRASDEETYNQISIFLHTFTCTIQQFRIDFTGVLT